MPKFLEEIQLKSLSAVVSPRDGVSLYNSGGVIKLLYPDGTEKQLMTGDGTGIDFSQYYTKEEIDALVAEQVGFSVSIVDTLPLIGNRATLYLLSSGNENNTNVYTEYLFVNDTWEIVGSTAIDLTDYYTKTEVDEKILEAITSGDISLSNYYTKAETDENIRSSVSSLIGSAPEAYDTLKEIADYIESDADNAAAMLASLNNKASKSEVYNISEANARFATKSEIPPAIDLTNYYTKSEAEQVIGNKINASLNLENYYTKDEIDAEHETMNANKQDKLISGTNIKTINGKSVMGYGNLELDLGDTVIANPILEGGEAILDSIQIDQVKYSLQGQDMTFSEAASTKEDAKLLRTITINDDDWKVDRGSIVIPNVDLTGDEEVLESVKIDDAVFTLKGEEMIFSETPVENVSVLRSIQLGDDVWAIPSFNSEVDLTGYATEYWVNTQGFIKQHQSLEGYAKESYVDTKVANLVNAAPETLNTLGELATALQSNQSMTDTLNTAITQKADKVDVYTKTEIDNNLATKVWVESKGYLNEHQSLAGYATETWTTSKLIEYAKKTELPTLTSQLTNDAGYLKISDLGDYATKSYVGDTLARIIGAAPETLDTIAELAAALEGQDDTILALETTISNKANKSEVYTKDEIDNMELGSKVIFRDWGV